MFGLRWPALPFAAWFACALVFALLRACGASVTPAVLAGCVPGLAASIGASSLWRRLVVAFGFPLALAVSGAAVMPAWAWLLPLVLLAVLYPMRAWRDAPVFPTPQGALDGLQRLVKLAPGARVLDAGCGLGHGLRELHRVFADARIDGIEWSRPLALWCAWRCRFASVRRGDIWAADWSGYDLVYLFQRPESMPRAAAKAASQLREGAWLASLEFEVPGRRATASLRCADGRRVWLYRAPTGSLDTRAA